MPISFLTSINLLVFRSDNPHYVNATIGKCIGTYLYSYNKIFKTNKIKLWRNYLLLQLHFLA
jgi:hypothetical protein